MTVPIPTLMHPAYQSDPMVILVGITSCNMEAAAAAEPWVTSVMRGGSQECTQIITDVHGAAMGTREGWQLILVQGLN